MLGTVKSFDAATGRTVIYCKALDMDIGLCVADFSAEQRDLQPGDLLQFQCEPNQGRPQITSFLLVSRPGSIPRAAPPIRQQRAELARKGADQAGLETASKKSSAAPISKTVSAPASSGKAVTDGVDKCAPTSIPEQVAAPAPAPAAEQPCQNEKTSCKHCGKYMVPCLVFSEGRPQKSFCPFCAKVHRDFIAEESSPGVVAAVGAAAVELAIYSIVGGLIG